MIDFNKISKIKTKKDIKKYKIDEPIFLSNYLFHYLIMTNNIEAMKLTKHPIYKENNEGLQGFHLAAKIYNETKSLDMIKYLLKEYPEYFANINYFNEHFLLHFGVDDNLLKLFTEFKKLDWEYILMHKIESDEDYSSGKTFLNHIFYEGSSKLINYILDNFKIDYTELDNSPYFELPDNINLNEKELINIFKKIKDKEGLEIVNKGFSLVHPVLKSGKFELLKYLVNNDIELDKYVPIYTIHPFLGIYQYETINNSGKDKYKISEYVWNNIKKTHNFNSTNKFGENVAYTIMKSRLFNGRGNYKIESDILTRNTEWNKVNIDKKTILNILIMLPFDKYSKFLKNKDIDVTLKDKNNKTIIENSDGKWHDFLKNFKDKKIKKTEDIKLKEYQFVDTNSFSSTILDAALFLTHLDNKYENLYLPKALNKYDHIDWDGDLNYPHHLLEQYNNFPWIIYWEDKNRYFIHNKLNLLIKSKKFDDNYDCAVVLLSLRLPHGGLHAEILFFDFKNNFIERFDPFGNSFDVDVDIDDILEEELCWNTGFSYLNVKKYLPVSGFQTLSDELNELNQKPGDFGGYCLAWCLWYLEHRIINSKFPAKKIVSKLIDLLLKKEDSLIEYIRNYANSINKHRLKILKEIGIKENNLTNLIFSTKEEDMIFNYIIKKTTIN